MNWKALLDLLKRMGFGEKWCKWIRTCISIVQFSILINGAPADFFWEHEGSKTRGPAMSNVVFGYDGGLK